MYIHGIYIVFSACILHLLVAGVVEEGRVPFPQIHIPLSKYMPMRRATKATAKRIGCWNRELTVIPGIYQVYAGIYLVYTKDWTVDKRLEAEAKNQAKMAKLTEVCKSYQVI